MELSECTLYSRAATFAEGALQGEVWSPNLILERREVGNALLYIQGRRMISLAHSCLWIFGGIISYPREP